MEKTKIKFIEGYSIPCYCGDCYQDIVLTLSDSLNYGITT